MDLHKLSLSKQLDGLKKGDFTSTELTSHYLNRISQLDGQLNSFITVTEDLALSQAKAADERYKRNNNYPLDGLPIAHKDIFCTKGVLTTCGSKMLSNFEAPYSSTVYSKLDENGMVMLGKTNMDEFAMGSSNETSYFGPVKNPWNIEYVPGGSSGGSASCVSAELAPIATATDTGGSIRQPASLCGLTGIKPTYGRVSRYGMIAFASSLDQGGVIAKSAEDAALILEAMSGHDPKDSTSLKLDKPDLTKNLDIPIKGMKIGLPKEFFEKEMATYVMKSIEEAIDIYKNLGAEIVEISLGNINLSLPIYYIIAPAECSANLSRYDGVRYGYRCEDPKDIEDLFMRTREEGFGAEVKTLEDKKTGEWMKNLEPEDLLRYGLIPEFIGRLPITATLDDLDEKSLIKILQEPKNSLIKQYQELFRLEGVKLTFKDQAVKDIANKAISKKTGARGLRSILENLLLKTMFDLPGQDNIEEVIIDAGATKGTSQPIIVHTKNKSKTEKTSAA